MYAPAVADPSSFLPVIRTITSAAGALVEPADELRIMSGLTVTYVPGPGVNGPGRLELDVYVPAPTGLSSFVLPVNQPAIAAGVVVKRTRLVFAATSAPSHVTGAAFFAGSALTANDTNFASLFLQEYDEAGASVGSPIEGAAGTTKITGTNASGDWTGGELIWDFGIGLDIAAGHSIVAEWKNDNGAGVTMPGGEWRIT